MSLRIAFSGASGTGKTTLARFISEHFGLPLNPVGSRSVSEAMGFASPYDVDEVGKRPEFQRRLLSEKILWESKHDSFVTDRTTVDNLLYTMLHDVAVVDEKMLEQVRLGMSRYTHVIYCPFSSFCYVDRDPARLDSSAYQEVYCAAIAGLVARFAKDLPVLTLAVSDLEMRKDAVISYISRYGSSDYSNRGDNK